MFLNLLSIDKEYKVCHNNRNGKDYLFYKNNFQKCEEYL